MEQNNLFHLIHTLEQMNNENIVRFTRQFPFPIGISPILVLSELKQQGEKKQVELAELLGYTKGAMTSIANKLVANGLAKRIYDENDRRIIQLCITEKGAEALNKAQQIGEEIYIDIFSVLTEEELTTYLTLQQKLLDGIIQRKKNKF